MWWGSCCGHPASGYVGPTWRPWQGVQLPEKGSLSLGRPHGQTPSGAGRTVPRPRLSLQGDPASHHTLRSRRRAHSRNGPGFSWVNRVNCSKLGGGCPRGTEATGLGKGRNGLWGRRCWGPCCGPRASGSRESSLDSSTCDVGKALRGWGDLAEEAGGLSGALPQAEVPGRGHKPSVGDASPWFQAQVRAV